MGGLASVESFPLQYGEKSAFPLRNVGLQMCISNRW